MRTAVAITLSVLSLGGAGCFGGDDDESGVTGTDTVTTGTAPDDQPADPQEKAPSGGAEVAPDDGTE